jgi:phage terminase large subunit GpA-like protein
VIDYRVIDGSPKIPDTWTLVLQALGRKYRHASGVDLPIHITFIDSGHEAEAVYDFVLKYQTRRIHCSKGYGGKSGNPIVGKPSPPRGSRRVPLYPINVDDAKRNVISSLDMKVPGPSYSHFPLHVDAVDEEYFAMLVAEHEEVVRNKRGVATHTVWVEDRPRNEALDTAVLCLAGFRKLRPNIQQMLAALADSAKGPKQPKPTLQLDGTPAATPAPSGRRVSRSGYLNR